MAETGHLISIDKAAPDLLGLWVTRNPPPEMPEDIQSMFLAWSDASRAIETARMQAYQSIHDHMVMLQHQEYDLKFRRAYARIANWLYWETPLGVEWPMLTILNPWRGWKRVGRCGRCARRLFVVNRQELEQWYAAETQRWHLCRSCVGTCGYCRARIRLEEEGRVASQIWALEYNGWICGRCAEKEVDLKTIPYPEYLKTYHWAQTRDAALERAGHRCQVCNKTKSLNVHHRTYARRGNERPDDLTVLCRRCHELFHSGGRMPDSRDADVEPSSNGKTSGNGKVTVTRAFIEKGQTERGGYRKKHLAILGVEYPPRKGWIDRLIGVQISDATANAYLSYDPEQQAML